VVVVDADAIRVLAITSIAVGKTTRPLIVFIAAAALCAGGRALPAAPQPAVASTDCTLRIHVDGFRSSKGNLGTVVFTGPEGWPEDIDKAFRHGPAPIDPATRTAVAEWTGLPPGEYGVAAIHDENSNHKLDRNLIGIPKEGFGFANNPHVALSAPGFREALVRVSCAGSQAVTDTTIHLIYK
jgi:uncharacterized protein (DUF2141 family)